MERKLAVIVPNLTEDHKDQIKAAAKRNGCELCFLQTPEEDSAYTYNCEIVFGHWPEIAKTSKTLQWIATPYAGVDQFLPPHTTEFANPEALLTNSSGAYGVTIAEHTVMVLLSILRRDPEYRKIIANKEWKRGLSIRSVYGSRITLLGTGDIGQETAKRLRAFEPKSIIGVNRSGKNPQNLFDSIKIAGTKGNENGNGGGDEAGDWESILPETDILLISLPGTKEAFHMLGKEQLAKLPDGAIVINVGRGSVIDQQALTEELQRGRLSAGLDVFEQEPLPQEDPLWAASNAFLTPHTAGNMTLTHTVDRIVEIFTENLDHYTKGAPLSHLVDRKKGY